MKVLDLFCGAGGAAMGLHRAWPDAEIIGVDIKPQKHYPFTFVLADAMTFPLEGYDFIWASPPCQAFSAMQNMGNAKEHQDLLTPMRRRLQDSRIPYAIENVIGAPMFPPVTILCGTMFGLTTEDGQLELRRHRVFETSFPIVLVQPCQHKLRTMKVLTRSGGGYTSSDGNRVSFPIKKQKEAMEIDWMIGAELSQAIPPAYSFFIAQQVPFFGGQRPDSSLEHKCDIAACPDRKRGSLLNTDGSLDSESCGRSVPQESEGSAASSPLCQQHQDGSDLRTTE